MKSKPILALALAALAVQSSAVTATFDSYSEGYFDTSIVDGGIMFSNLDMRITGPYTPTFTLEDASGTLSGFSGFSPNNVLGFGGYVPGPYAGFGRMGSFDFTGGFLANAASLTVFSFGNDPGMSITLQGLKNGSVVGTSSMAIAPYNTVTATILSLTGGAYDTFRVVSSGPTNSGTTFVSIDNVTINPAPEPSVVGALGIGIWIAVRRRR